MGVDEDAVVVVDVVVVELVDIVVGIVKLVTES